LEVQKYNKRIKIEEKRILQYDCGFVLVGRERDNLLVEGCGSRVRHGKLLHLGVRHASEANEWKGTTMKGKNKHKSTHPSVHALNSTSTVFLLSSTMLESKSMMAMSSIG
jgi:hypothetical protein